MKSTIGKNYYALLCDCSVDGKLLICGVYASRKEAKEVAEKIRDCKAKHKIVKCSVKIIY